MIKKIRKKKHREFKNDIVNKIRKLDNTSDTKQLWALLDKLDAHITNAAGLDHTELLNHFESLNKHTIIQVTWTI